MISLLCRHCALARSIVRALAVGLACTLLPALATRPASAQDSISVDVDTTRAASGWDSPRVLDIMSLARARRAAPLADTALHNYRATAEGFVYFYLDRRANDEKTLVRVNQVALELYWRQPNQARQRIVGTRDASPLPNTQRYHLDHFTMVQNGFDDIIRMGDGDEVRDVPHPAATGSQRNYEFRLADSIEIRLQSSPEPIRVYEVQVRPRDMTRSALIGSLFVDRATGDLVRMTFTFTPASYVDSRLDYINVSLDNALWDGRYWLPNEQTVEIRRQLPILDFAAGAVIRGRMSLLDYELNAEIPDSIFRTPPVVALPEAEREAHSFTRDLYEGVRAEGLSSPPALADLREEAARLAAGRLLSGLPALRLYMPEVSTAARFNRAEGVFLGTGLTYSSGPPWRFDALGGYAFAAEHASLLGRVSYGAPAATFSVTGYARELRDIGPVLPFAGAVNTLSSAFLGSDYLDPWFADGMRLSMRRPVATDYAVDISAHIERQRSAGRERAAALFDGDALMRPVRPIGDGRDIGMRLRLTRPLPAEQPTSWTASLSVLAAHFDPEASTADGALYFRSDVSASLERRTADSGRILQLRALAGITSADAPRQQTFLLGGRGTLPGYPYRAFAGRRIAFADAVLTQELAAPWLGVRALAAVGSTGDPAADGPGDSGGIRASAGAGVALLWNTLFLDAVRGLNDGEWKIQLSFTRSLDDIL